MPRLIKKPTRSTLNSHNKAYMKALGKGVDIMSQPSYDFMDKYAEIHAEKARLVGNREGEIQQAVKAIKNMLDMGMPLEEALKCNEHYRESYEKYIERVEYNLRHDDSISISDQTVKEYIIKLAVESAKAHWLEEFNKGLEEGRRIAKLEEINSMLEDGIPLDKALELTELGRETYEKYRQKFEIEIPLAVKIVKNMLKRGFSLNTALECTELDRYTYEKYAEQAQ